jgi:hypothetical protein
MRWCLGLAVSMLLAAGCGAAEHEPDLAAAVDGTRAQESWRFELRGTQDEGGETVPISCAGEADDVRKRLHISCDHEGGGFAVRVLDGVRYARGGGRDASWQRSAVDDQGDPEGPRHCKPAGGTPIQAGRAIAALRRGGFSVERNPSACFAGLATVLDNMGPPGVLEREGIVICHLYERPRGTGGETIVRREVDGGDATLVLANLECLLFTDRPDPEPGIERLEQAFRELER